LGDVLGSTPAHQQKRGKAAESDAWQHAVGNAPGAQPGVELRKTERN
jgi:hypothetical protein